VLVIAPALQGQDSGAEPPGRLDQIRAERLEKSRHLRSEPPAETAFDRLNHFVSTMPLSVDVGGLGPGKSIGAGAVLPWNMYRDRVVSKAWGHVALHLFYEAGTGIELRNVSRHDFNFALEGSHSDSPQLEYYGEGPNSSVQNNTNYRREDTLLNFRAGFGTHRHLEPACRLGQLWQHVGPGTNEGLPTTQSVFGPAQAPGIDMQKNFVIGGCSVVFDLTDFPGDPHKGTYALAVFDRYHANGYNRFSFSRLSVVGEQYVPYFNEKRVIVLRAKTDLSFHGEEQVVPFYLQPTLGSDTELRGFARYRFYDENSLALTAEYRWDINAGIDMALFADAGKVFHRPEQISLSEMETSVGFGIRVRRRRNVVARFDTGFSREGVQLWLKVANLF
jgi:hypothetical protein